MLSTVKRASDILIYLISITTPQSSYYYYPQYTNEETKNLHLKITQLVNRKSRITITGNLVPEPGILMLILFSFVHGDNYISHLPTLFILFLFFLLLTPWAMHVCSLTNLFTFFYSVRPHHHLPLWMCQYILCIYTSGSIFIS